MVGDGDGPVLGEGAAENEEGGFGDDETEGGVDCYEFDVEGAAGSVAELVAGLCVSIAGPARELDGAY